MPGPVDEASLDQDGDGRDVKDLLRKWMDRIAGPEDAKDGRGEAADPIVRK